MVNKEPKSFAGFLSISIEYFILIVFLLSFMFQKFSRNLWATIGNIEGIFFYRILAKSLFGPWLGVFLVNMINSHVHCHLTIQLEVKDQLKVIQSHPQITR